MTLFYACGRAFRLGRNRERSIFLQRAASRRVTLKSREKGWLRIYRGTWLWNEQSPTIVALFSSPKFASFGRCESARQQEAPASVLSGPGRRFAATRCRGA